jgi:hypothetical protein
VPSLQRLFHDKFPAQRPREKLNLNAAAVQRNDEDSMSETILEMERKNFE